jgi:hypothetical protein
MPPRYPACGYDEDPCSRALDEERDQWDEECGEAMDRMADEAMEREDAER